MTTTIGTAPGAASTGDRRGGPQIADVFVMFGISGDVAKAMTFNSPYRLERRGLLGCPIVGMAVSDCSVADHEDPLPVHPQARRSWGAKAADQVLEGHGRWHEPWVAS